MTGIDPLRIGALFGVGVAAGAINVMAGGGSMLTLPVMIFFGLPPTVANGTNRVAILLQNVGAVWGFHRRGMIPRRWLRWTVPPALAGAIGGTWAAVVVGDLAFQRILALVLLGVVVLTLWKGPPGGDPGFEPDPPTERRARAFLVAMFGVIGLYGGFIQVGVGFVTLATLASFRMDLVRANALKVTVVLLWTTFSLAIFASRGKVDWAVGGALAAGTFTGAHLGVHWTVLKGQEWVKRIVILMAVIFAGRLLLQG